MCDRALHVNDRLDGHEAIPPEGCLIVPALLSQALLNRAGQTASQLLPRRPCSSRPLLTSNSYGQRTATRACMHPPAGPCHETDFASQKFSSHFVAEQGSKQLRAPSDFFQDLRILRHARSDLDLSHTVGPNSTTFQLLNLLLSVMLRPF